VQKLGAAQKVAVHNKINRETMRHYIRLNNLIPQLVLLVDTENISVTAGADLSILDELSQTAVHQYFYINNKMKMDMSKSADIKEAFKKYKSVDIQMLEDMFNKKPREKRAAAEEKSFTLSRSELSQHFESLPDDETLTALFAEFLRKKLNARGQLKITRIERILI